MVSESIAVKGIRECDDDFPQVIGQAGGEGRSEICILTSDRPTWYCPKNDYKFRTTTSLPTLKPPSFSASNETCHARFGRHRISWTSRCRQGAPAIDPGGRNCAGLIAGFTIGPDSTS
jgi:hypothetical protein